MEVKLGKQIKSRINQIKSISKSNTMNKVFQIIILLMISQNVKAQISEGIKTNDQTTILLSELQLKVTEIKTIQLQLENTNLNSNEIEQFKNQLSNLQKDMIVFLYHSLQERCTTENRLLELSSIVQPIDSRLAEKFVVLNAENSTKK
jgi:hypothetical protein